jgi:cyclase
MRPRSQQAAQCLIVAYALFQGVSCATKAQELPFTLTQVGPNVWAAISNQESKTPAWANVGFVIGDDSVAIIDTTNSSDADGNFSTEPAQLLFSEIRKLTKLPVRFVINTHYHVDHVGANAVFVNAGAVVLSHDNVRGWIHTENLRMFGKDIKAGQKVFIEALVPPTVTYDQKVELYLGSRRIRLQSFPGHTGGDSVVRIPDAKVVFTGDLFWRNIQPNLIDASIRDWIDTLDTLLTNEAGTTFVPGHGEVGTTQDVATFREYLATLRTLVSDAQVTGKSGQALVDGVMPAVAGKYKSWDKTSEAFEYFAKRNILEIEAELNGNKRVPQSLQGDR